MASFGIGKSVRRVEDRRFLLGAGRYVEDIVLPREAHGALVPSPHAHARIAAIDTAEARDAPGVLCVLTGADALADGLGGLAPFTLPEDAGGPKAYRTQWTPLAGERVRCVGDRVAFVVAETAAQAREAADLVRVSYEPLACVSDCADAAAPGAPLVWPECPGNVCFALSSGSKDAADAAFAKAAHVVRLRLKSQRLSANPMEPRGAIGDFRAGEDAYTLYTTSQNPHGVRTMLAAAVLHIAETRLRVISPDVGGGFGMKANAYPEDALVLWASRRCGRPVKWIASRTESLAGDNHGRDCVSDAAMALDAEGRIVGLTVDSVHALGAYLQSAAASPVLTAVRMMPSVYAVGALHLTSKAVFTNASPMGVYRGAGRPEANYVVERLIDRAAAVMGLDPVALRRRNLLPASALPHRTATGSVYDSGDFPGVMERCLALGDWPGFAARRAASEAKGLRRGRAVGCYIERGGVTNDRMGLRFDPGGTVTVLAGTHSHGQGHATTYAQMVAEWLGVPFDSIRFAQGDTDAVPFGRGTYAARSSLLGGCALKLAADGIIDKARALAAFLMEAAPEDVQFSDGVFAIAGTDRKMSIVEVAKASFRSGGVPPRFLMLEASGTWAAEPPNYPNGCHVAEVEVDPGTGRVALTRYTVVDDIGRVINPMICEGQVHGALAQVIGQALLEEVVYDRAGQLVTGSFIDYAMPRADDLPAFAVAFHEVLATTNPLGVKGVGETAVVTAPATIVNAILDALRPLGVDDIETPASPERVWRALQAARRR
ncbi:MAG TPA: xanthine dehydrogenase family protein molybdopterin-binding subunit [Stellaceae bacterium]|nr:xanthine dehydrogenase family protein molybdopterin-binding subunit [Stellaceae bacterium]